MGLFSFLRPSPEKRLDKARAHLARGLYADARMDALELGDLPGAAEVVAQAEEALARLNIEAAVSWAEAGEVERIQHHLELADAFRSPATEAALKDAHARIAAIVSERQRDAARAAQEDASRLLDVDPRFKSDHGEDEIPLPPGVSADEEEALKARLAMLHDAYPEDLRHHMIDLGSDFVQAVLDLEDGQAESALGILVALPDDDPLVLHERARAAQGLGDHQAAARAWRAFAQHAGGHRVIGQHHTGVLLAGALASTGGVKEALAVLEPLRKEDPLVGGGLYPSLLEADDQLPAAEKAWRALLTKFGTQPAIYLGIARVRVKGGHRMAAMQALETSLDQTTCEPGRCGYRPPDLPTYRMLATLYFEDGIEHDRAMELSTTARGLVQQPTWDDLYLAALSARHEGDPKWTDMAAHLVEVTPPTDPRSQKLSAHLAA